MNDNMTNFMDNSLIKIAQKGTNLIMSSSDTCDLSPVESPSMNEFKTVGKKSGERI